MSALWQIVLASGILVSVSGLLYLGYRVLQDGVERQKVWLEQAITTLTKPQPQPQDPEVSFVARLEDLEFRFEQLQRDCLKYLRKGKGSLARAEQLARDDFEEDEDGYEEEDEQLTLPITADPAPASNGAQTEGGGFSVVGGRTVWNSIPPHLAEGGN